LFDLTSLKDSSRLVRYPQGTLVDDSTTMHVIFQGEAGVIVSRPGEHHLAARLGPGDFFHETALFLQAETADTIVALTDLITLPLRQNEAVAFFAAEPAFAYNLCRALCERLHGQQNGSAPIDPQKPVKKEAAAHVYESSVPAAQAVPVKTAEPVSTNTSVPPGSFSLFPEGHEASALQMDNTDREHLMEKSMVCPLCHQGFKHLAVRPSKLILENTDSDMRQRYKGVEPLYYDVITCPHCLYSALSEMFDKPSHPTPDFLREMETIKSSCSLSFGLGADIDAVFAGYYLALFCAPHCFHKPQMAIAKLYLKLSRIYQDAENSHMETFAAQESLDAYMYVYQNIELSPSQDQQLCLIIAELSLKLGRLREAKDFFFKVKINRNAAPLFKRQAENRLFEIRESEK
jgi:uncharacterized protein (DUF2225 family)